MANNANICSHINAYRRSNLLNTSTKVLLDLNDAVRRSRNVHVNPASAEKKRIYDKTFKKKSTQTIGVVV